MPTKILSTRQPTLYQERQGGTGVRTPSRALEVLNGVSKKDKDKLVILNHKGYLKKEDLPLSFGEYGVRIEGPTTIESGHTYVYQITNFNSFTEYVLDFEDEPVKLVGDKIIVSPNISFRNVTKKLTVNGRSVDIQIKTYSFTLHVLAVGAGGGGAGGTETSGAGAGGGGLVREYNFNDLELTNFEANVSPGISGLGGTYNTEGESGTSTTVTGSIFIDVGGGEGGHPPGGEGGAGDYQGGDPGATTPDGIGKGGTGSETEGEEGQPGVPYTIDEEYIFGSGGHGGGAEGPNPPDPVRPSTGSGGNGGNIADNSEGGSGAGGIVIFNYTAREQLFEGGDLYTRDSGNETEYFHVFKYAGVLTSKFKDM